MSKLKLVFLIRNLDCLGNHIPSFRWEAMLPIFAEKFAKPLPETSIFDSEEGLLKPPDFSK